MTHSIDLLVEPYKHYLSGFFWLSVALLISQNISQGSVQTQFLERYIAVALALLGLYRLLYRKTLVIDNEHKTLTLQKRFIFVFKKIRFSHKKAKAIVLRIKTKRTTKNNTASYFPISLLGVKNSIIYEGDSPVYARTIAEKMAITMALPFHNRVYSKNSVRSHEELNLPLLAYWEKHGLHFQPIPLPTNTQLTVKQLKNKTSISTPFNYHNLTPGLLIVSMFAIATVLLVFMTKGQSMVANIIIGVIDVLAVHMFLGFVGSSKIILSNTQISLRTGWHLNKTCCQIDSIEEYIIAPDSLVLVGDASVLSIDRTAKKEDNLYLEKMIPFYLQEIRAGRS